MLPEIGRELAAFAKAVPDLTIILNHLGGLTRIGPYANRDDEVLATWRGGVAAVAQCPNVNLKPALQELLDFEISAVCTTRQDSAAAARHYGVPLAFCDAEKLAQHPDVDLVAVSVKGPITVMAQSTPGSTSIANGRSAVTPTKPPGCAMRQTARASVTPWACRAKCRRPSTTPRTAEGYVGRVLSVTMIGCAPNWGPTIDRAYQADFANGANLLTITGGHTIDALCYCLGEFRELVASVVSQRDRIPVEETGELIAKTVPDQLAVNGIVGDGTVVSFQIRGGMNRGTAFLLEIHGDHGDLQLTATSRASMQRQELNLKGARGDGAPLADLSIPGRYRWIPEGVAPDSRYNVAQLYARLAEGISGATHCPPNSPGTPPQFRPAPDQA